MKMRFYIHIILFLVICLLWQPYSPLQAQPVDQQTALQRARQFMGAKRRSITQQRRAANVSSGTNAYCYVFNADHQKGYVVVSGDDRTPAILGYCEDGVFDEAEIPQNLRSWIQHYADEIAVIQQQNITVPQRAAVYLGPSIPVQITCKWDQRSPYNLQCPMVTSYSDEECTQKLRDAQQAVTGCSATALAQVLYAWKEEYQAAGAKIVKDIPERVGHKWEDPNVSQDGKRAPAWLQFSDEAIPAGTVIDWGNLIDDYGKEGVTDAQKAAVAQLMHICGAAMEMDYGVTYGSGSSSSDAGGGLGAFNHLGFENVRFRIQQLHPYQEWLQLLYDEVKVARAVFFTGQSSSSGHAFVIDGYDSDDFFHVNWGWSGHADSYYRIGSLFPTSQGTGGSLSPDGFRMGQVFSTGLYPNAKEPADKPAIHVLMLHSSDETVEVVDKSCTLSLDYNIQVVSCPLVKNCQVGFCLEGQGEKQYYILSEFKDMVMYDFLDAEQDGGDYKLTLTGLVDGDYKLYPCFRTTDSEAAWEPCVGYENFMALLNVHGDEASISCKTDCILSVLGSDAKAEYSYNEDVVITYRLKVEQGSLHDVVSVRAVPVNDDGSMDDTRQETESSVREMYYVDEGVEFDLPCKLSSLEAGDYLVIARNGVSEVETELGVIKVTGGTDGIQATSAYGQRPVTKNYNLQGTPVTPAYRGLVICQQGDEVKKVYVK